MDGIDIEINKNLEREKSMLIKIAYNEFSIDYAIDKHNVEVIERLLLYFFNMPECENENFKLKKSILLAGGVGTGKTLLMKLISIRLAQANLPNFRTISSADLIFDFSLKGMESLQHCIKPVVIKHGRLIYANYCIDEIGLVNETAVFYKQQEEVVAFVLNHRYRLLRKGIKTHATTNLTPDELREKYGERLFSRFKEQFNYLVLPGDDRRC